MLDQLLVREADQRWAVGLLVEQSAEGRAEAGVVGGLVLDLRRDEQRLVDQLGLGKAVAIAQDEGRLSLGAAQINPLTSELAGVGQADLPTWPHIDEVVVARPDLDTPLLVLVRLSVGVASVLHLSQQLAALSGVDRESLQTLASPVEGMPGSQFPLRSPAKPDRLVEADLVVADVYDNDRLFGLGRPLGRLCLAAGRHRAF